MPYRDLKENLNKDFDKKTVCGTENSHEIIDFCFFLFIGIIYIITAYITHDGVFRLFMPLSFIAGLVPSVYLSKGLYAFFENALIKLTRIAVILLNILLMPLRHFLRCLFHLFKSISKALKKSVNSHIEKRKNKKEKSDIKVKKKTKSYIIRAPISIDKMHKK